MADDLGFGLVWDLVGTTKASLSDASYCDMVYLYLSSCICIFSFVFPYLYLCTWDLVVHVSGTDSVDAN